MAKQSKFWPTLSLGVILGIILSCIMALGLTLLEWNRRAVSKSNKLVQAINMQGISSGQTKVLNVEGLLADISRKDVSVFMKKHKFRHAGSRVLLDNLRKLNQPSGYTEMYESNVGHPLCSFKYLVITYYDESSHLTKALASVQPNGCV